MLIKLKKYRFLFEELVKRDFKKKYKRTVLGMAWSMLSPLLTLLVMAMVFGNFFGRSTEHFIIYLFSGNLLFSYFNDATTGGMRSLMSNATIFTKVDVPKYMFLLSRNVQALINFILTLIIYFLFVFAEGLNFWWGFFTLLYPIIFITIFNIGLGMVLSALYVFFRDMEYLYSVSTMLLMYCSAIFYTVDSFSIQAQSMFRLNPVYVYISYFRQIVIVGQIPSIGTHVLCAVYALIMLGAGSWMYKKYNHQFLYYI